MNPFHVEAPRSPSEAHEIRSSHLSSGPGSFSGMPGTTKGTWRKTGESELSHDSIAQQSAANYKSWLDERAVFLDPIFRLSTNIKVRTMVGPGEVEYLACSEVIVYPATASEQQFILHAEVPELVNPLVVLSVLQNQGSIRGKIAKTELESTFFVTDCNAGHYEFDFGSAKCSAHLLRYEPRHSGHRGRFAAGYSNFLCGLQSEAAFRVVLRATTPKTQVILSRSYSADCERFAQQISNICPKHQPQLRMLPTEEIDVEVTHEFEKLLQEEEKYLLEEFMNMKIDQNVARSQSQPSKRLCRHLYDSQFEEPSIGKKNLLHALGVTVPVKNPELEMKLFPCKQCDMALFRETRVLLQRNSLSNKQSSASLQPHLKKYFAQRFRLISRFEPSLELSDTAWFSVCPEEIAKHIGRRIAGLSRKLGRKVRIMDLFCGAGGNIVQAALMDEVEQAFASDINESEVECAKRLANLYGVRKKLSFSVNDAFDLEPHMFGRIDAIVCSPPWGGPSYLSGVYDLATMKPCYNYILTHCAKFTRNMAFLLPRNVRLDQLIDSAAHANSSEAIELEINFIAGTPKTSTVYYGDLANK